MKINKLQHITRQGVVKRNPPKKDNVEIMWNYRSREDSRKEYFNVEFVPVNVALQMTKGDIRLDLSDIQNSSPEARKMIEIAKKYKGWVGGYIINEPDREDNRITFDTLLLPMSEFDAMRLQEKLQANEFGKYKRNVWRFWWD